MTREPSPRRQSVAPPQLAVAVDERRDHVQGRTTAPVTLVEYGDYQCPHCGKAYRIVKRLQRSLGENLRFVFRNFPLTQLHPQAEFAAELAEAGATRGKFWEMHDFLYENQAKLVSPSTFLGFAKDRLGLDAEAMESEVGKHVHLPRIQEDFTSGIRSGVIGTPTFYLNGSRHDRDYEFETLAEIIRAAASR